MHSHTGRCGCFRFRFGRGILKRTVRVGWPSRWSKACATSQGSQRRSRCRDVPWLVACIGECVSAASVVHCEWLVRAGLLRGRFMNVYAAFSRWDFARAIFCKYYSSSYPGTEAPTRARQSRYDRQNDKTDAVFLHLLSKANDLEHAY